MQTQPKTQQVNAQLNLNSFMNIDFSIIYAVCTNDSTLAQNSENTIILHCFLCSFELPLFLQSMVKVVFTKDAYTSFLHFYPDKFRFKIVQVPYTFHLKLKISRKTCILLLQYLPQVQRINIETLQSHTLRMQVVTCN